MKKTKENTGITLIALIITIIVLLILAGVSIATLTGNNGIISQANEAKVKSTISQIKEEIELYKTGEYLNGKEGEEAYPIAQTEEGQKITIKDMLTEEELSKLPEELKYQMLSMQSENSGNTIPSIDNLDYTKFYKLDTDIIQSAKEYKDKLVIFVNGDNYKVIHLDGINYENSKINIIIPLNNEEDPKYVATSENVYKLYGNGTVKVIGQKNAMSGISNEEYQKFHEAQELDLAKINAKTGNKMNLPAKKTYISNGTIYVIDQDNELWAWGDNSYNKLGQGNSYLVTEPTKILEGRTEGAEGVKAKNVWAGVLNTFVIDEDGNVWMCGNNTSGQLGQGNTSTYSNYVKVNGLEGNKIQEAWLSLNTQSINVFVKYNDGTIYAAGTNYYGTLGIGRKEEYQTTYINISQYDNNISNVKKIELFGENAAMLKENGELYMCGYNNNGSLGTGDTVDRTKFEKVAENVKDVKLYVNRYSYIDKDGNVYKLANSTSKKINTIPAEELLYNDKIIINGNLCELNGSKLANFSNVEPVENVYGSLAIKVDGKIYTFSADLSNPKSREYTTLQTIFQDAIFMQGNKENINIVNKKGEIYENLEKNSEVSNVKKIVASPSNKYIITNDNKAYAKGTRYAGTWGNMTDKQNYTAIMKNANEELENIKEIYVSQKGYASIITTNDNKIYWAGSNLFVRLPNILGDVTIGGMGDVTRYPKEVTSETLNRIKDKIKDIKFDMSNTRRCTWKKYIDTNRKW